MGQSLSAEELELKTKVKKLVDERFGGRYRKAFDHYDKLDIRDIKDGKIGKKSLMKLLNDAKVGSWAVRGFWAKAILKRLDQDEDFSISWGEFESALEGKIKTGL